MKYIRFSKQDLAAAMAKARQSYALAGPVRTGEAFEFRRLQANETPDLSYKKTSLSPKSLVFPPVEPLFSYPVQVKKETVDAPRSLSLTAIEPDNAPLAVVGIRPYDARAFDLLKLNFDTSEYKDPYFIRRIEALTLIGLAENQPDATNFSLACGTGPFDESSLDILLAEVGDGFIGKVLTPKGEAFSKAAGFEEGDQAIEQQMAQLKEAAEKLIPEGPAFDNILKADTLSLYNDTDWDALAFACINCGTCTFSCPTCWCFDIQDEVKRDKGIRVRLWDTCMSDLYSAHASGHNPREKGAQRFRNRFMHKLKYFSDKYEKGIMCVGCGRCVSACPVNIDIRDIITTLDKIQETGNKKQGEVAS